MAILIGFKAKIMFDLWSKKLLFSSTSGQIILEIHTGLKLSLTSATFWRHMKVDVDWPSYVSFLRRWWHLSLAHSSNRTCLWLNHNCGSHWSSCTMFDPACDQLFLKDVKLKLFYAKDEEFVQIFIYTVPSEPATWNCGKLGMENRIRSFSKLFFFELHFCVYLTDENAVLGWEDFFVWCK